MFCFSQNSQIDADFFLRKSARSAGKLLSQIFHKRLHLSLQCGALLVGEDHAAFRPGLRIEDDTRLRLGHHVGFDEGEQLGEFSRHLPVAI